VPEHRPPDSLLADLNAILEGDPDRQFLDPADAGLQQARLAHGDGRLVDSLALERDLALLGLQARLNADDADRHQVLDEGGLDGLDTVVLVEGDLGLGQEVPDGEGAGCERADVPVGNECDGVGAIGDSARCQREQYQPQSRPSAHRAADYTTGGGSEQRLRDALAPGRAARALRSLPIWFARTFCPRGQPAC
jgi:hypothetical protein